MRKFKFLNNKILTIKVILILFPFVLINDQLFCSYKTLIIARAYLPHVIAKLLKFFMFDVDELLRVCFLSKSVFKKNTLFS